MLGRAGQIEEAEKIAKDLILQRAERYISPGWIAQVFAVLGDSDRAFKWLFRGYEERDGQFAVFISPGYGWGQLPSDPRWNELLSLINHPLATHTSVSAVE